MILILSTAHGHGHGAEIVLNELLAGLSAAREKVLVAAPEDSRTADDAQAAGHAFVPYATRRDAMRFNLLATRKLVRTLSGITLVHAWHARGFEQALWLASYWRVPVSGTLHDHPRASIYGKLRHHAMRLSANRFKGLACVSKAVEAACRDANYQCPLTVILNGLANAAPPPRSSGHPVRIGFLAMHARHKGFPIVADWIRRSESLECQWQLYGEVADSFRETADLLKRRYPGRVVLPGRKPVADIFSEIDILVHASSEFDPLPTVLIEAARAGIPAVASHTGGAPEIILPETTGILFDPKQSDHGWAALADLIRNPARRESMGQAARLRYESNFQVSRMTHAYLNFWRNLTRQHT